MQNYNEPAKIFKRQNINVNENIINEEKNRCDYHSVSLPRNKLISAESPKPICSTKELLRNVSITPFI